MMEELIQVLATRLADGALPLYLADAVPENTPFPYMTAEVVAPFRTDKPGSIRLNLWCAGANANQARVVLHTTTTQYFPGQGMVFRGNSGRYVLRPESASLVQSGEAKGISTLMEVRFYPAGKEGTPV